MRKTIQPAPVGPARVRVGRRQHRGTPRRPRVLPLALVATAVLLAGCSDDSTAVSATKQSTTSAAAAAETSTTAPTAATVPHDHQSDGMTAADPDRATNAEFPESERAVLAAQLVELREVALRYPTLGDAAAAGFEETTPYVPGTGMHMGRDEWTIPPGGALDLQKPQSYLYNGNDPEAKVVGMMFVQLGGDSPPDGFAGPLDTWNRVGAQCLSPTEMDRLFPNKADVTKEECEGAGGNYVDLTAWIQHVWVVPGWEAPGGVFAQLNTDIVCADGSSEGDPETGCEPPKRG